MKICQVIIIFLTIIIAIGCLVGCDTTSDITIDNNININNNETKECEHIWGNWYYNEHFFPEVRCSLCHTTGGPISDSIYIEGTSTEKTQCFITNFYYEDNEFIVFSTGGVREIEFNGSKSLAMNIWLMLKQDMTYPIRIGDIYGLDKNKQEVIFHNIYTGSLDQQGIINAVVILGQDVNELHEIRHITIYEQRLDCGEMWVLYRNLKNQINN